MIFKNRKTIFILLFVFLAAILFFWFSVKKVTFFVNNSSAKALCLYADGKFLSVIPSKSTVELRLKSSNNTFIGVSEKIGGLLCEEFPVKLGGKSLIYNITDFSASATNNPGNDKQHLLRISGKIPEKAVQQITIDTLHRMIMNKLPSKMESLKCFRQTDAITMAGDIGDMSSMEWLLSVLKLPEHRIAWEESLRSIGKIGGNNALVILRKYIKNEDLDIVIGAVDGLRNVNTPAAQQVLIEGYYATDRPEVKSIVIEKMSDMPISFDIKAFVLRELDKGNTANLDLLLQIIGKNKIKEAIPFLRRIRTAGKALKKEQVANINSTIKKIS